MHKKCVIVFSGFNERAVIAFIRTLETHKIQYAIIATSKDDYIFSTTYVNKVIAVRQSVTLILSDIINSINKVKGTIIADEYIIAPSSEALNRFLLDNKIIIESGNCIIPLVPKADYESISNKYSFGNICDDTGIKVPYENINLDEAPLPFVAKPKEYFSSDGSIYSPFIIVTEADKKKFIKEHNHSDFFYQQYIYGKSLYLLYYFQRNGKVYKYSQENYIQQPDGKSIVAAISSNFHNTIESQKYEKLLKSLNFFGLIMIEVKQQDKINYMIEANPRFWGPSQLFVDAKMNLFEAFLYDFELLNMPPIFTEPKKVIKYFWHGGIIKTYKLKKELSFHQSCTNDLMNDLPVWLQSDVFRRPDTYNVFKNELS